SEQQESTYEKESKEEDKYRLLGKQLAIDASFEPVMALWYDYVESCTHDIRVANELEVTQSCWFGSQNMIVWK
ncbi:unnamed protein product, partial [Musa acuminata var. zebrina]